MFSQTVDSWYSWLSVSFFRMHVKYLNIISYIVTKAKCWEFLSNRLSHHHHHRLLNNNVRQASNMLQITIV